MPADIVADMVLVSGIEKPICKYCADIEQGVWTISVLMSASIADYTVFATMSTSSNILWILKQVLLIYMDIAAGNVTQEIDCRN